jgi:hypothetical protein
MNYDGGKFQQEAKRYPRVDQLILDEERERM